MEHRAPRQERGVPVLYYLCRNGQLEHLHFMEFLCIPSRSCTSEHKWFLMDCRTGVLFLGMLCSLDSYRMGFMRKLGDFPSDENGRRTAHSGNIHNAHKSLRSQQRIRFTRQLHSCAFKTGFASDTNTLTGLVIAYAKCKQMEVAHGLFSLVPEVSWTAMVGGYLENGMTEQALHGFRNMWREDIKPNEFTFSTILTAAPVLPPSQFHAQAIKAGYESSPKVGTALLTEYVKLCCMEEAAKIFSLMDEKDKVSWSAMLMGYAQIGDSEGAARLFRRMTQQGLEPNEFTFSGVLNACSSPTAAVEQGKQLHGLVIKSCFDNAICVSSALVTMYARRGDIDHAFKLFMRHTERDIVSWNSMISCYAQHGRGKKALEVFSELENEGLQLDGITFVGVLTACNHAGLVDEGSRYFKSMTSIYHVQPTMEHYACMVDLYSRAGQLESAMSFINEMPFPAGPTVWRTLLGGIQNFHLVFVKVESPVGLSTILMASKYYIIL
ncbi:Pentatricopeptide repeat-containing protein [Nymphaea thermarum]|nr:Pentatricopeptide repeat-containing protein [Nymphaea thermarum]